MATSRCCKWNRQSTLALGFRKAYKITNGNQTSGAGAGDRFQSFIKLEAHVYIANSGWN